MACWNSNCCLLTGDSYSWSQLRCFPFRCHICVRLQSLFLSPLACAFIFVHSKQRFLLSTFILFIDHRQCIKYLTLKQLLNFSYLTIFTMVWPCVNSYNLLLIGWGCRKDIHYTTGLPVMFGRFHTSVVESVERWHLIASNTVSFSDKVDKFREGWIVTSCIM